MSNKDPRLIFWVAIHEKKTFNISRTDWYWVQWKAIQYKGNALEIRNLLQRTIEPDTHIFDVIIFCLEFIYLIHPNDVLRIIVQDILRPISFFFTRCPKNFAYYFIFATISIRYIGVDRIINIPFIAFLDVYHHCLTITWIYIILLSIIFIGFRWLFVCHPVCDTWVFNIVGGIMNYLAHTWMNIQTDTFIVDLRLIRR